MLAIGRIGDKRGLVVLADLQRTAPRNLQPSIAAAICLLGSNCGSHVGYLMETLKFAIANPGYQELLRAAAGGLVGARRRRQPGSGGNPVRARRADPRSGTRGDRPGARARWRSGTPP